MWEEDICNLLRMDTAASRMFNGVYAIDEIPDDLKSPGYIVVNTEKRGRVGSHWVLFFNGPRDERLRYFDAYGLPVIENEAKKLPIDEYNETCVQSYGSVLCGLFCVYVAIRMSKGFSLKSCVTPFSKDLPRNDMILIDLIKRELFSYQNRASFYCFTHTTLSRVGLPVSPRTCFR